MIFLTAVHSVRMDMVLTFSKNRFSEENREKNLCNIPGEAKRQDVKERFQCVFEKKHGKIHFGSFLNFFYTEDFF